jgi:protein-disulfide isomerase/uncharacterized membrane protein
MSKTQSTSASSGDQEARSARAARLRRSLFVPLFLLVWVGFGSNVYLNMLYVKVHKVSGAAQGKVDSFCNVSKGVNCVAVAASKYSALFGIPIAIYGAEFYGLLVLVMLLSAGGIWGFRRWDSLLFLFMLLGLPVSATMAYISIVVVKSLCLMCTAVYAVNILILAALAIAYRGQLKDLLFGGMRELIASLRGPAAAAVGILAAIAVSQIYWVPPLVGRKPAKSTPHRASELAGIPQEGLTIGTKDAVLIIDEFTDYECPHCSKAHSVMLDLVKKYPDDVLVRHHDFPLDQACNRLIRSPFHRHACTAAFFARCAADQGKYWPYAARVFHSDDLSESQLLSIGKSVGLSVDALERCARGKRVRQQVLDDIELALRKKVRGTPTFFLNNGKETVVGPRPLEFWERKLAQIKKQ